MLHPWLDEEYNDQEVNNLNAKYYEKHPSDLHKPRAFRKYIYHWLEIKIWYDVRFNKNL